MEEAIVIPRTVTYKGNCHCGAVRYTLDHPDLAEHSVGCCNCSICTRNGYLFIYPTKSAFKYLQGEDKLTEYHFGARKIAHNFCRVCGTSISAIHPDHPIVAVNVRAFESIDVDKLKLKKFDGAKKLEPMYEI